jgi:hypothetical protein
MEVYLVVLLTSTAAQVALVQVATCLSSLDKDPPPLALSVLCLVAPRLRAVLSTLLAVPEWSQMPLVVQSISRAVHQ